LDAPGIWNAFGHVVAATNPLGFWFLLNAMFPAQEGRCDTGRAGTGTPHQVGVDRTGTPFPKEAQGRAVRRD
jgi:hypothetical protein